MYVVLGWFSRSSLLSSRSDDAARSDGPNARLAEALDAVVPLSYKRYTFGGADWGLTVCEIGERGAWCWPVVDVFGPVTAISLGIPLGLDSDATVLARRLLAGDDIHAEVAPPFSMIAMEGERRAVVQQDWLGMGRLFAGESGDTVFLGSRPGLVADMLSSRRTPDRDGWASYVANGHFGGELSPFAGVRLLAPGERLNLQQRDGGGWDITSQIRTTIDDLVERGLAARSQPLDATLDQAAAGIATATAGINRIYGEPITLGLSGGKDSRVVLASMIAAGTLPRLRTNIDTAAEGEVASRLVEIMRDRRDLDLEHELVLVGKVEEVTTLGLEERVHRLQAVYDYQFPSSYIVRRAGTGTLPERPSPASITGAGGEMATGYWYPPADSPVDVHAIVASRLLKASGPNGPAASVAEQQQQRLTRLIERGRSNGLEGLELADYMYLLERVRRWYTSAYTVGMVTPFLTPGFIAASFALTPEQKRNRTLHSGLLARFTPEWADVPFVSVSTGPSTAARMWDGDGLEVVHTLLDTVVGGLTDLMDRDAVGKAVVTCAKGRGNGTLQAMLQQYAAIAVASKDFDPGVVRPPTQTYASFLKTHQPRSSRLSPIVRQVKRTAVGRAVISGLKKVVR